MNWIDPVVLVILIFFVVKGWRRGLLRSLIGVVGFFLSVFLAANYLNWGKELVLRFFALPAIAAAAIGFLLIFLISLVLFQMIGSMVRKLVHLTPIGYLDSLGGMLLGLVAGGLIASLLLLFLSILPLPESISSPMEESALAPPIRSIAPFIFGKLKEEFPQIKNEVGRRFLEGPSQPIGEQAIVDSLMPKEIMRHVR